jgi:hypothetical protein
MNRTDKANQTKARIRFLRGKHNIPSVLKTVRHKCLDCVSGSTKEARICPTEECPLWPYRMGRYPSKEADLMVSEFDAYGNVEAEHKYKGYPVVSRKRHSALTVAHSLR